MNPSHTSTLPGLIAASAAARPQLTAVRCGSRDISRRELDESSNRCAHLLRSLGVSRGDRVGVAMVPSIELVTVLLGVLKAGAAYVPLDPAYPPERIRWTLEDCQPEVVVCDAEGGQVGTMARDARRMVVDLSVDAAKLDAQPSDPSPVTVGPDDLAYLIYTSGSTGVPKGALTRHGGICNSIIPVAALANLTEGRRLLHVSSLNWDMSVFEIFGPLAVGAELVIATADDRVAPRRLARLMADASINVWSSAPAIFDAVLEVVEGEAGSLPEGLRTVMLGGDRVAQALVSRLAALSEHARILNVAGVTEVSYASMCHLTSPEDADRSTVPWGKVLAGQTAYILDSDLRPVPEGEVGELYLGGAGVGSGYWRRPALTAQRFLPDPFHPPGRMYRTGDLVRALPGTGMEFLGRADGQVKVAGVRIELGEVETTLERHPSVRAAVAVVRSNDGPEQLIAYACRRPGALLSPADCQSFLAKRLPDHLVPHRVVMLTELPLLPNGKVDKQALPIPDTPTVEPEDGPADPEMVDFVCRVFAEITGADSFAMSDNFFAKGGNSLAATRVMTKLRQQIGVRIPIRLLFEAPTPQQLARQLRTAVDSWPGEAPVPAKGRAR